MVASNKSSPGDLVVENFIVSIITEGKYYVKVTYEDQEKFTKTIEGVGELVFKDILRFNIPEGKRS